MRASLASPPATSVELPCVCGAHELGAPLVSGHSRSGRRVEIRPCARCGLRRTNPPPNVAQLLAGDYQDESDFANQVKNVARYRGYARRLLDTVARRMRGRNVRLLDVGCGIGVLLDEARKRGWDAHGLDVNEKAAQFGRDHFGLDIRTGSVEALRADGERFSAVVLSQVLEHLERPHEVLRSLSTISDLIAIESPNMDGLYPRILRAWWYPYSVHQHLWHYTPSTIHIVAEHAGLKLDEVRASHCVDYGLPAALTDIPGYFDLGDNLIAVFSAR